MKREKRVTILTPTYNRVNTLDKLYSSLINQTNKDFVWLIIDDGSKDNTKQKIDSFIEENKIEIKYFYQPNGGKHRALNNGVKKINTELTFIVDSDDWLVNDAIETIIKYANKYKNNKKIGVISFLKAYPDFSVNGPKYKKNEYIGNYVKERLNNDNWGDKAEVCFTKVLKEYPLKEIDGEKFLSEGYLWLKISDKYNTVYINKIVYICDYLDDGLTKNIYKHQINNPLGVVEVSKLTINCTRTNLYIKIKNLIKYIAYSNIAKISTKSQIKHINHKFLYILTLIPGILYKKFVFAKANH